MITKLQTGTFSVENVGFGLGVLLAILGPLLLLPITWVLYRYLMRPWVLPILLPEANIPTRRLVGLALTVLLVALTLSLSYLPGKREFDRLCASTAIPKVNAQVKVPGFFRNHLLPYEARIYLETGAFDFVEAPHPYRKQEYLRYTRGGQGRLQETVITKPASQFWVLADLQELSYGLMLNEKRIIEFGSGKELARAAQVIYQGGPLSWLLGVYAMHSCPDPGDPSGVKDFQIYAELEQRVLGGVR